MLYVCAHVYRWLRGVTTIAAYVVLDHLNVTGTKAPTSSKQHRDKGSVSSSAAFIQKGPSVVAAPTSTGIPRFRFATSKFREGPDREAVAYLQRVQGDGMWMRWFKEIGNHTSDPLSLSSMSLVSGDVYMQEPLVGDHGSTDYNLWIWKRGSGWTRANLGDPHPSLPYELSMSNGDPIWAPHRDPGSFLISVHR